MAEICEICGNQIRGPVNTVKVDISVLRVCSACAKLGEPVKMHTELSPKLISRESTHIKLPYQEHELELRRNFNTLIKSAREKLNISQEDLGLRINEKLSVIKHLETGKLRPNDILARKVERFLKIKLLVPQETEE